MNQQVSADIFTAHRPLLFSIAYRMLGSASDAEDIVQEAWLRYAAHAEAERGDVRSPKAFASTIVTRLCLDRLKSARAAREQYVGPWLPEPVLTAGGEAPDTMLQRSESVTLAFLVLLETLSPEERAVFLLKEIFEYDHAAIAAMLDLTPANSRQLFHRAKARIAGGQRAPKGEVRRELAERFARALHAGDATTLAGLLTREVSLVSDGGGKVSAARRPLEGREEVLNFLVGLHRVAVTTGLGRRAEMTTAEVNGEPAMVLRVDGRLDGLYVMSVDGDEIAAIRVVRNPDKLAYVDRQLRHETGV
jgi:RNA polymerase sigma-70 factor (ECF subfamily)